MHRRLAFGVSICGMVFVLVSLVTVLQQPEFVLCCVGLAFLLLGVFFAIESVAKSKDQKK
jgi:hypothetical protein